MPLPEKMYVLKLIEPIGSARAVLITYVTMMLIVAATFATTMLYYLGKAP